MPPNNNDYTFINDAIEELQIASSSSSLSSSPSSVIIPTSSSSTIIASSKNNNNNDDDDNNNKATTSTSTTTTSTSTSNTSPTPTTVIVEDDNHPALNGSLTPPNNTNRKYQQIYNFSPGPTNLPKEVENNIKNECFPSPHENKLSSIAISHRSPEFLNILQETKQLVKNVMNIPSNYEILFMHGGGHGQFASIPLNLCTNHMIDKGTYIVNGTWSKRAVDEGKKYCIPIIIKSESEDENKPFPNLDNINIDPESKFIYICTNETVNGIELHRIPKIKNNHSNVPLIIDASSDFTSKPIDFIDSNIGILFACASKNIGHPGVTIVIIRNDLLGKANILCPSILDYTINIKSNNVYNTTPTFNIDVIRLMMKWIIKEGGINKMEKISIKKSYMIYDLIDNSNGFYSTPFITKHDKKYRSRMNIPFRITTNKANNGNDETNNDELLTKKFLIESWEKGIVGLHTKTPFKTTYLRASLYHGVSINDVIILCNFMKYFANKYSNYK